MPDGSIDADGLVDMVIGDDDEVYYPKEAAKNTHYLPVILDVPEKSVITYIDLAGNLQRVAATDTELKLLLTATKKENFVVDLYANMTDAKMRKDANPYTVDLTNCELA